MLPSGKPFTFLVESDKLERIHKVVAHNGGEILDETPVGQDVKVCVQKALNASGGTVPSEPEPGKA
ncbi:MAG: hypothetical protein R6V25_02800 [Desulfatiglandales bacterium]